MIFVATSLQLLILCIGAGITFNYEEFGQRYIGAFVGFALAYPLRRIFAENQIVGLLVIAPVTTFIAHRIWVWWNKQDWVVAAKRRKQEEEQRKQAEKAARVQADKTPLLPQRMQLSQRHLPRALVQWQKDCRGATPKAMTPRQFAHDLDWAYRQLNTTARLNPHYLDQLFTVFIEIFINDFKPLKLPNTAYKLFLEACVRGLTDLTQKVSLRRGPPSQIASFRRV